MFGIFRRREDTQDTANQIPEIMGLRMGCSFEVDSLHLKLIEPHLIASGINCTHIVEAVGRVDLDDTTILRFYTDDEAFLQVVCQGPFQEDNVIDVKLFHYFSTMDIASDADWRTLLEKKMGVKEYSFEGGQYARVWESSGEYHNPVAMTEKTYSENGTVSETDQFVMLFEKALDYDNTESLFLSAEEMVDENNNLSRCFVISTGISLTPSQIVIHG